MRMRTPTTIVELKWYQLFVRGNLALAFSFLRLAILRSRARSDQSAHFSIHSFESRVGENGLRWPIRKTKLFHVFSSVASNKCINNKERRPALMKCAIHTFFHRIIINWVYRDANSIKLIHFFCYFFCFSPFDVYHVFIIFLLQFFPSIILIINYWLSSPLHFLRHWTNFHFNATALISRVKLIKCIIKNAWAA